ncbi:MAG: ABC transporter ATP-binding protein [Granulosicoccus sp.]
MAQNSSHFSAISTSVESSHVASGPLVVMENISKAYPGVLANDAVSLSLQAGSIHALLGENGAGKSTLVKILYGLLAPDSGCIHWRGQAVSISAPDVARKLGISMVFQHFSLFDSLTVLENIALGMGVNADEELRERIINVSAKYGLPLDPSRSVYTLSVGAQQRIEIVRCLLQDPKLLIMDEPTSVLTPLEVTDLFSTLNALAESGMTILYISHKLEEIRTLCSGATILRQGRKVAEADPRQESVASLAALMMGDELQPVSKRQDRSFSQPVFALAALDLPASDANGVSLHDINLQICEGEIVGIAGVAGNGQDELLQVIAGERLVNDASQISLDRRPIGTEDAGQRRRFGLCCVPEERLGHAAVPSLSLAENVFLTAHHRQKLRIAGLISYGRSRKFAQEVIQAFNVQCQGPQALASSLSGGNLQKFIVGREILQSPRVLVISQPTWGVDAGAAAAIHKAIAELARQGAGILMISQDLDELMQASDRIGALCAGRLSAFHPTRQITVRQVGLLMGGETLSVSSRHAVDDSAGNTQ